MSSEVDIHHLAAAYTLDALDERERVAFEQHYPSCEVCRTDVGDFRATLALLATAASAPPPPELKARVMDEVARTRQLSPITSGRRDELAERRGRRLTARVLAVAAVLALLVVGSVALVGRNDGPSEYSEALASVMAAGDARFDVLTAQSTAGAVKVAWSAERGMAVLIGQDLPGAPEGMAYELWLITDAGPLPQRVLQRADGGQLRAVIPLRQAPGGWGVTIEPEGGSPAPTGPILFSSVA